MVMFYLALRLPGHDWADGAPPPGCGVPPVQMSGSRIELLQVSFLIGAVVSNRIELSNIFILK
jgi:hypothetical protein